MPVCSAAPLPPAWRIDAEPRRQTLRLHRPTLRGAIRGAIILSRVRRSWVAGSFDFSVVTAGFFFFLDHAFRAGVAGSLALQVPLAMAGAVGNPNDTPASPKVQGKMEFEKQASAQTIFI